MAKELWYYRYNGFHLLQDLARPRHKSVKLLYYFRAPYCKSTPYQVWLSWALLWEIMVVVSHVILQDHVMKRLSDFMGSCPSRQVSILQSLVTIGTLVVELKWFKFLTWSSKTTCDFMIGNPSWKVFILPSLEAVGIVVWRYDVFSGWRVHFICPLLNTPLLFISKAHSMSCLHTPSFRT